jgi:hypothetical protein
MIDPQYTNIKEKAVTVVRLIQDEISVNPRSVGKNMLLYKIKSDVFFKKIKEIFHDMDEITWVKILKFLREKPKFNYFYEVLLSVPFEHDGGSIMHFPEVYPGTNKTLVRTTRDVKNLTYFYPDVPGIDSRFWKKGEMVYVPSDKAQKFIEINWMEKVETDRPASHS